MSASGDIPAQERAGLSSPVGPLQLTIENGAITQLDWVKAPAAEPSDLAKTAIAQLAEYFAGQRQVFDLPLRPVVTPFQQRFYAALCAIPYGQTQTYGDLSDALGASAQAIGRACGANTIPIIIPCHRVLAANNLGGFSGLGGVETKVALLRLEGAAGLLI